MISERVDVTGERVAYGPERYKATPENGPVASPLVMDNLNFSGAFDGPLIPTPDQWPTFDSVVMCSFSPDASPDPKRDALPSAADLAAMPIPPSRTSLRNKDPNHIPRPRNAFMLFRSAFAAAQKIASTIEHDNRHITRIIAHCWNRLSESEKQVWRDKAAAEKRQHAERYPNYRFSPTGRGHRRVKRNVRRNGVEDVKRCEQLAELVMAGKLGHELESAIKQIDEERLAAAHVVDPPQASSSAIESSPRPRDSPRDVPPFRSPLLAPTETVPQQIPEVSHILSFVVLWLMRRSHSLWWVSSLHTPSNRHTLRPPVSSISLGARRITTISPTRAMAGQRLLTNFTPS